MIDRQSEAWLVLKRALLARIEELRRNLETPNLPPEGIRGEIAALRWVIKTVEPDAPIIEPTSVDYMRTREPDPT